MTCKVYMKLHFSESLIGAQRHPCISTLHVAAFLIQEQSSCGRDCMACKAKAKNIYYLVLYRKGLLTPWYK